MIKRDWLARLLPKFSSNAQKSLGFEQTGWESSKGVRRMSSLSLGFSSLIFCGGLHAHAANPASTDYVNQQINAAVQRLTAQINAIPTGKQGEKGEKGDPGQYVAGDGIAIENGKIQLSAFHHLGELYQGGTVFFVDATGQHGLIAAPFDVSPKLSWQNGEGGEKIVNAKANGIFAGDSNTRLIIAEQTIDYQQGNFAALEASNFSTSSDCLPPKPCYGGWYLPSIYELELLFIHLAQQGQGDFAKELYWSSTETGVTEAWSFDFNSGEKVRSDKATESRVRPIRAF